MTPAMRGWLLCWVAGMAGLLMTAVVSAAQPSATDSEAEDRSEYVSAAPHAILIDAASGETIYEKDADSLFAPASMAKLMTAILAFDALKNKNITPEQEFPISVNAWRKGGAPSGSSTMYAEVNSSISVHNLLMGALTISGNDACIALAEGIAGSEEAFATQMTERARALGLNRPVFTNATGLPDPQLRTTARDLAEMARYIIRTYPEEYRTYFGRPEFTWNKIRQHNRNPLLGVVPGVDGLKTGHTKEAGFGLVASAERNGRRLILVVAGLKTARDREAEASKLLAWGFGHYKTWTLFQSEEAVGKARVWGGDRSWVSLVAHEPIRLMLTNNERARTTAQIVYKGPLYAPVNVGDEIGIIRFSLDGKLLVQVPLYAGNEVLPAEGMLRRAVDTLSLMVFGS